MRIPALAAIAMLTIGATDDRSGETAASQTTRTVTSPHAFDMPPYGKPSVAWRTMEDAEPIESALCRDRIWQAREELGQPDLDRETASPDEPLLMWAVDHRREGCGVIVMKDDPDDIRPIPEPNGSGLLIPAQAAHEN